MPLVLRIGQETEHHRDEDWSLRQAACATCAAMDKLRRAGFNLPKAAPKEIRAAKVTTDFQEWHFVPKYFDWRNAENESVLTGFNPTRELINLLENNIDKCKE